MLLSKDQILSANDIRYMDVEVPEWGGTVRVGTILASERNLYEQSLTTRVGNRRDVNLQHSHAKLVALCVVDLEGKRVFTEDDVHALSRKSSAAVDRVFDAAAKLNRISEADLEELRGNLKPTQTSGSSTS
jgi:hypothetical protein